MSTAPAYWSGIWVAASRRWRRKSRNRATQRVVWIAENTLDHETAAEFERAIGVSHPVAEVLTALPESSSIVFDGIERYEPRALRLACRLMQELLADAGRNTCMCWSRRSSRRPTGSSDVSSNSVYPRRSVQRRLLSGCRKTMFRPLPPRSPN